MSIKSVFTVPDKRQMYHATRLGCYTIVGHLHLRDFSRIESTSSSSPPSLLSVPLPPLSLSLPSPLSSPDLLTSRRPRCAAIMKRDKADALVAPIRSRHTAEVSSARRDLARSFCRVTRGHPAGRSRPSLSGSRSIGAACVSPFGQHLRDSSARAGRASRTRGGRDIVHGGGYER